MREALRRQGVSEMKIALLLKRPEGKLTMNVVQAKWKDGYKSEAKRKKEAAEKEARKKQRKLKKNSKKAAISET